MRNLYSMMHDACSRYGDKAFLTYKAGEGDALTHVSFRQFEERVRDWARGLQVKGIGASDRVAIITPKCSEQITAFYACWSLGAVAVPVCECLGDLETGFILRDSEPKVILVDPSVKDRVEGLAGDEPVLPFSDISDCAEGPVPEGLVVPEDDTAALIYTSGSTGMPKGVMLTHRNFFTNASSSIAKIQIRNDDTIMSLLPYWHCFALVVEVLISMKSGAGVIIPRDKRDFVKNIGNYAPSVILVVPRIADALMNGIIKKASEAAPARRRLFESALRNAEEVLKEDPGMSGALHRRMAHAAFYSPVVFRKVRKSFGGRLRFIVSGGAPLDLRPQLFFKYLGIPIMQGYGLTESTPVISCNPLENHRLGSSGPLLDWLDAGSGGDWTFLAEDGRRGKDVHGELLVKGDCVMKGYWRHRDASAKTLADGWLHTGDVGYVDKDGFLFLDGRLGNMICLKGGEKLHPEPVEDAIKNSLKITEAMVIGESCKNVYVCVNVDPDAADGTSSEELLQEARDEVVAQTGPLAAFQKPKEVLVLPAFQVDDGTLTPTFKIRRRRVWQRDGTEILAFLEACGEDREALTKLSERLGGLAAL
ncbi:MAG: AMP-binding protein [Lentisphaerae bacterium]|jgi:long-chain acyl-CoA synthetase|nr:AMP-binding protein [Lentisphaerota bacterium]MBT4815951.1 AMP-binding protein [Lentisphaerota bacterium]MBT5606869.1 AMP-binding protein [Lentisphaerota bacterium]MBT7059016.1 AMP-binding protein [Lentisphaerota bacterium]MBT7843588.1 AMP-binding protein [Lentisphaerota bacterium]